MKTQRITTETHVDYVQIGSMLREARETHKMTQDEVAATLRFRLPWVEAMEQGDLSIFPSMVYAKGYLANYAKLVGLEAVMHQPPVKEVVVDSTEASRRSVRSVDAQAGATPVKIVQKVVQATPLPAYSKMPMDAVHVVATSSVRDRRVHQHTAEQGMRGLYWLLIIGLLAVIGWMLQERMDEKSVKVSDVRAVPQDVVPEHAAVITGQRVFMADGVAVPLWMERDCSILKMYKKKMVHWPTCYAIERPYYQQQLQTVLQFQSPMMVIR